MRQIGVFAARADGRAPSRVCAPRQEEADAAQTAQRALLTLLCEGRIPPETVEPGDFAAGPLRDCAAC